MTTKKSMVTAGETADSMERQQLGGVKVLRALAHVTARGHPTQATERESETYPQDRPRGGENERTIGQILMTNTQRQPTVQQNNTNICVACRKVCKNSTGVRIHQGRMGCLTKKPTTQGEIQ